MGAVRSASSTGLRLAGVLLLAAALAAGLIAPGRAAAATFAASDPVVTTDSVNVRTKPDSSAPIRAVATVGQSFTIGRIGAKKADGYTWYRVSTARRVNYGWIASEFLALGYGFGGGECAGVADGPINLRSKAGTGGSVVTVLADGAGLSILDTDPVKANGYVWYKATAGSSTGWVAGQFLAPRDCGSTDTAQLAVGGTVRVFDGPLNAREQPATSAVVVRVLPDETIGYIVDGPVTADGHTWFEFRNLGGPNGWVVDDFIVADPNAQLCDGQGPCSTIAVGDGVTVTTDALNVRTAPGFDGAVIDVAAYGATGTRVAGDFAVADSNVWVKVSIPNVGTGWVVLDYVEGT